MSATPSEDAIRAADLVFNGTVEELGASTVAVYEAGPNTAVVRVDEVIQSSPTLAQIAGQRVTVELDDPSSAAAGQQYTIYATVVMLGETLVVRAVSLHPVQAAEAVGEQVRDAAAAADEAALRQRAQQADLVVRGKVSLVRPSPAAATEAGVTSGPISEHDPQWWEAVIDVDRMVKGEAAPTPTVVLFPFSRDIAWRDAPKFQVGQEGVWMLHTEQVPTAAREVFPTVYTALDPKDFQPREQADRLQRLLEGSP